MMHNPSFRGVSPRASRPPGRALGRVAIVCVVAILSGCLGVLRSSSVHAQAFAGVDDVRWGYLENGSGYLIIESHAAPMIGGTAVIHAGSGMEDWSTQGASHFLEHLLFNGTKSRTQEQIYDEMDLLGAYNNATTRSTHVVFMLLASRTNFWPAFAVQRDMLFHSTLPAEKVEKERGIILEELAKDRVSSEFDLERLFQLDAFGAKGYGLPTLGSEVSIESISREEIARFYETYYVPNNITWVLIGDLDAEAAVDSLAATVGRIPARPLVDSDAPGAAVDRSAPRMRVHHAEVANPVVQWVWEGPDPGGADFEAFRARFELQVTPETGVLYAAATDRWGSLASYRATLEEFPGRSVVTVRLGFATRESAERAVAEFAEVAGTALATPPSAVTFDAWKRSEETAEIYLREKPHYYGVFRGDRVAARGLASMAAQLRMLRELTALDVASARLPLGDAPARVSVVLPLDAPASDLPENAAGPQYEEWTLDNGARVAAFSSAESEVLAIHLFVRDRSAREPQGKAGIAELLHALLGTATASRDESQLRLALQSIGAELKTADSPFIPYDDFYTVPEFSYLRFQSLDRDAETSFALVREIVAEPRFDASAFERARSAQLSRVQKDEGSARQVAYRAIAETLGDSAFDPGVYGSPSSVESLTLDDLHAFAPGYLDPAQWLIVVASGRPLEDLRGLTAQTLGTVARPSSPLPMMEPRSGGAEGSIPDRLRTLQSSGTAPPSWVPGSVAARFGVHSEEVGAEQSYVALVRGFAAPPAERPVLTVANGVLSDRLAFQLREREGLAYSIGSSLREVKEGEWAWIATAGTRPENLARISEGFAAAVDDLLTHPPGETEVRKTAASLYGRGLMRRATRLNLCYYAGLALLEGRSPLEAEAREQALEAVTAADVTRALQTYVHESPGVLVVAR